MNQNSKIEIKEIGGLILPAIIAEKTRIALTVNGTKTNIKQALGAVESFVKLPSNEK